jgi:hypothetical protein
MAEDILSLLGGKWEEGTRPADLSSPDAVRFFPGTRVGYIVEAMDTFAERDGLMPRVREFLGQHADSEPFSGHKRTARSPRANGSFAPPRGTPCIFSNLTPAHRMQCPPA